MANGITSAKYKAYAGISSGVYFFHAVSASGKGKLCVTVAIF